MVFIFQQHQHQQEEGSKLMDRHLGRDVSLLQPGSKTTQRTSLSSQHPVFQGIPERLIAAAAQAFHHSSSSSSFHCYLLASICAKPSSIEICHDIPLQVTPSSCFSLVAIGGAHACASWCLLCIKLAVTCTCAIYSTEYLPTYQPTNLPTYLLPSSATSCLILLESME
ncbi:hypothetical protein BO82DRAFT_31615 [Aspergillus uvarum CBS 121591]|uniref:Uncharacterized protein n=1 Tax=Aspergillus uvarum CBS 121591 TaxID=1448315 RepID=A0A319CEF1_9EURO|nr:hypothetical protein BO82DRAFT_31615 [Aspergillus uvarum CBS 121591]PYH84055.1 hypothetical protein BO82DRAFT_31615 [Aspergillus uvarum CBS 121591]